MAAAAVDETVALKENGRRRRITKLEAAAMQLANRAANGDERAMQLVVRLIGADDPRPAPKEPRLFTEGDKLVAELAGYRSALIEVQERLCAPRQALQEFSLGCMRKVVPEGRCDSSQKKVMHNFFSLNEVLTDIFGNIMYLRSFAQRQRRRPHARKLSTHYRRNPAV